MKRAVAAQGAGVVVWYVHTQTWGKVTWKMTHNIHYVNLLSCGKQLRCPAENLPSAQNLWQEGSRVLSLVGMLSDRVGRGKSRKWMEMTGLGTPPTRPVGRVKDLSSHPEDAGLWVERWLCCRKDWARQDSGHSGGLACRAAGLESNSHRTGRMPVVPSLLYAALLRPHTLLALQVTTPPGCGSTPPPSRAQTTCPQSKAAPPSP